MDSLDLNIDNYDFDDILNLFEINIDFNENDLKKCKSKVLMMHPDKSNLNKDFFIFYSKAYKILFYVYKFRHKNEKDSKYELLRDNYDYDDSKDESKQKILDNLKNSKFFENKNFNKWFNEMFEKVKLEDDFSKTGYGDWLKNEKLEETNCNNLDSMNKAILEKKQNLRENILVKYNSVSEFNNNNYCDINNSNPECYSSSLFDKLQYEDLKKAHTESVVPVTDEDFQVKYNSFDDLKFKRNNQNLDPLSEKDSYNYLRSKQQIENTINSNRAYKLLKKEEELKKINNKWWKSLQNLK